MHSLQAKPLPNEFDGLFVQVAASVGLIANEEQVKAAEAGLKAIEIEREPTSKKTIEGEAPAEVPASQDSGVSFDFACSKASGPVRSGEVDSYTQSIS